jgi:hypothetical protein
MFSVFSTPAHSDAGTLAAQAARSSSEPARMATVYPEDFHQKEARKQGHDAGGTFELTKANEKDISDTECDILVLCNLFPRHFLLGQSWPKTIVFKPDAHRMEAGTAKEVAGSYGLPCFLYHSKTSRSTPRPAIPPASFHAGRAQRL